MDILILILGHKRFFKLTNSVFFQVTPISVSPKAWDSQNEFLQEVESLRTPSLCIKLYQVLFQVGLKLYMFVPAIVAGTLLSISFWILAMMIIRR